MRETALYPPLRDHLIARGHEVHVEIFECDVVATKDGKLLAIELKVDGPEQLLRQLLLRASWADYVIGVMPHRPKHTRMFKYYGFGLMVVSGGKVREVIRPRPQPDSWHRRRAYRLKKLSGRSPAEAHEVAGLPSCPALRAQRKARTNAGSL